MEPSTRGGPREEPGGAAPARPVEECRVLVVPPLPVRFAKRCVEGIRRGAPWLLRLLDPIKPALARPYYAWVNRHERLAPEEFERRQAKRRRQREALADASAAERRATLLRHVDRVRARAGRLPRRLEPAGVIQVIGTLGPGGAERQLVTLARAVASDPRCVRRPGDGPPGLSAASGGGGRFRAVTMRPLTGADAHHGAALAEAADLEVAAPTELGPALRWLSRHRFGFVREALPQPMLADLASMLRVFRRRRPDVVHAWLDWTNVTAGVAALLLPVPRIVISTRNVAPHRFPRFHWPFYAELYRLLLEDPRVVAIANSEAGAADYAQWLGIDPGRFRIVRNGIDIQAIRRPSPETIAAFRRGLGIADGAPLVAGAFRLDEEKAPLEFIAIAERILRAEPEAAVVIAGDGAMRETVRAALAALGEPAAGRIHLLGAREDVPTVLGAATCCLLASHHEGTPNVLIEAQHLGCPVVATRVGGTPETLDEGRTGLLRAAGDIDGLAEDVLALIGDPERRRRLAAAGPAFVAGRFGIERMVAETIACYR